MSKDVKFNIKLSIDGKEHIVEATTDVKHFAQELGIAETKGKRLRDSLLKFNGLVTMFPVILTPCRWNGYKKKRMFFQRTFSWRASCRIRTNDPEITNHVLWPTELKRQVGKLTISRRYNQLPLLRSSPGGFEGSWPYRTYPAAKVDIFSNTTSVYVTFSTRKLHMP